MWPFTRQTEAEKEMRRLRRLYLKKREDWRALMQSRATPDSLWYPPNFEAPHGEVHYRHVEQLVKSIEAPAQQEKQP